MKEARGGRAFSLIDVKVQSILPEKSATNFEYC